MCVRTPSAKRKGAFTTQTTTFGATTDAILDLREHLLGAGVTLVRKGLTAQILLSWLWPDSTSTPPTDTKNPPPHRQPDQPRKGLRSRSLSSRSGWQYRVGDAGQVAL